MLAGLFAGSAGVWLTAQSPPPPAPQVPQLTFRALANYVEIDALVTDARGAFVKDLRPDEFQVFENGVRQQLSVCSFVELPIERADRPLYRTAIEPDILTNQKPFDGRVYMIVLDGNHIAATRSTLVRQQARYFVERYMGANDLAAVVHIGNPGAGQEVTANKRLLIAAIERFIGAKPRPATLNRIESELANQEMDMGVSDLEEPLRAYNAVESMETLRRLSQFLGGVSGRRKAVLFFSEGIDYNVEDRMPQMIVADNAVVRVAIREAESVVSAQQEMIRAATRANVAVYSIDPRGLATGLEDAVFISALPVEGGVPLAELADELRRAQDSLRSFADQTGGRAIVNTNDALVGFSRIVQDNSLYYVLGYQSTNTKGDGRFRNVTVRVTRPGLEVRARKGYYAPLEKEGRLPLAADPVAALLGAPVPIGGLGLRLGAGVLRGPDEKSTVLLTAEISSQDLSFETDRDLFANDVDVAYQVLDESGGRRAFDRATVRLRLRPITHQSVTERGMRYVTEFALLPGRYQVRFAARERVGGRAGSVFYDLAVPDFAAAPVLAMSDVFLTTTAARATLTTGRTPYVTGIFASPTTVSREWTRRESLGVFAVIYDRRVDAPHTVDLRVAIHADHGTRVFLREDPLDSREIGRDSRGFPYRLTVPLQSLAPGRYVLTVEARSRLGQDSVIRETEFTVR
jgi:VWFA-related protein